MWIYLTISLVLLLFAVLASTLILGRENLRKQLVAFTHAQDWLLDYRSPQDYLITGEAGNYPLQITPFPQQKKWIKAALPLANPNEKYFSISQHMEAYDWWDSFYEEPFVSVKHDLGAQIDVRTNDPWFSSFLLGDEIKAKIREVFEGQQSAVLYIREEEMAALLPGTFQSPEPLFSLTELLVALKEELKKG